MGQTMPQRTPKDSVTAARRADDGNVIGVFLNRVSQVRFLPRAPMSLFRVMLDEPASPDPGHGSG